MALHFLLGLGIHEIQDNISINYYFSFVITMLTAHALIPSLVNTGHLPESAERLRVPLTGFAALVFVAGVVILVLGINATLDVRQFWDRLLI